MNDDSPYEIRALNLSAQEIAACAKLLRETWSADHLTPSFINWQYTQNPDGKAVGFNAYFEGLLAAHYVCMPITCRVFGHEEKGLLSLNTVTHPDHGGKGLFTRLAKRTYESAAANGFGFVVGVANQNSTHGFKKKLDFTLLGPLEARLGIGPIRKKARPAPYQFERVWSSARLQWRLSNPQQKYHVRRGRKTAEIRAPSGRPGILASMATFPLKLLSEIQEDKCLAALTAPFRLWIGLDRNIAWGRSLYLRIPMKLRPSPLNLIFKDLTSQNRQLSAQDCKFNAIDFDPY